MIAATLMALALAANAPTAVPARFDVHRLVGKDRKFVEDLFWEKDPPCDRSYHAIPPATGWMQACHYRDGKISVLYENDLVWQVFFKYPDVPKSAAGVALFGVKVRPRPASRGPEGCSWNDVERFERVGIYWGSDTVEVSFTVKHPLR